MNKYTLLTLCFFIVGFVSFGQKIAHINTTELFNRMPESKALKEELMSIESELNTHLNDLMQELEALLSDIKANETKWSAVILKANQQRALQLQNSINNFQLSAQQELQKKELELYTPIFDKMKNAIDEVAKKNGYEYVIDSASGNLLVMPEGKNIIDLVEKELGTVVID